MTLIARSVFPDARCQLASLPQAVMLLEPGMRIATANPAAEQFLGQSARLLAGRKLTDALAFADPHLVARMADSEAPISAREVDIVIRGKGPRRVDLAVAPVADTPGWQLVTIYDNSAVGALGEDSGSGGDSMLRGPEILAHEIKNPLAGIRGAAQLLARKVKAKDAALTDLITSEVDRIATLIEQMQILSGKTTPPLEPCNLHEVIHRAIAIFDAAEAQGGQSFPVEQEFDPSLPNVQGHADSLVQVLINLIANARDACATVAVPRITVRTRFASGLRFHDSGLGRAVRLPVEMRITDNGSGVDPAMRDHIFEPFVTSKKQGQGLGLALVRKLVRDMSGRISHERDDVAGLTHFRIHLPLASDAGLHKPQRFLNQESAT